MNEAGDEPSGADSANEVNAVPAKALREYRMSFVSSCSPIKGKKYGSVLIIHRNQRVARFLDGVLRNGFRVRTGTDSGDALGYLRTDPPDCILCDVDCLGEDSAVLLDALENDLGFLEIPVILILRERSGDLGQTRRLLTNAADCVSLSIDPYLLKWKVMNVISLKREVAHLRESESETRKRSERFESLAHMVAHDLKSSVLAVNVLLRRLKARLQEESVSPDTREMLDRASSSCQFVEGFLSDMNELLCSDRLSTRREAISLDRIAAEVADQHRALMEHNEVDIEVHAPKNLSRAIGNRNRIKQVFDNLVTNALRHMGNEPDPTISITIAEKGELLVTTVSDNGVGIPAECRETIFQPHIRSSGEPDGNGRGLGLSIVKNIVDRHNGSIWVETESGQGARFIFTLPKYSATE